MRLRNITIKTCTPSNQKDWISLRAALYPHCSEEELAQETSAFLKTPERQENFLAYHDGNQAIGLLEVSIRQDYVNGTETSPVAFIESLYVIPAMRRHGIAGMLMKKAEQWAKSKGHTELASDAYLDNTASHNAHKALGFEETERVVYFRKDLK